MRRAGGVVGGAADLHLDEAGGPFAVARHGAGQVLGRRCEALLQGGEMRRIEELAGGEGEQGVVGAGAPSTVIALKEHSRSVAPWPATPAPEHRHRS